MRRDDMDTCNIKMCAHKLTEGLHNNVSNPLRLAWCTVRFNKSSQSHLGRKCCYRSRQRLDSPASSTIPTADEFNHSATGTLHRHGNATCHTLHTAL